MSKNFFFRMMQRFFLCHMINSFFNSRLLPSTRYLIDKYFYPKEGIEYHAVCPTCKMYISPFPHNQRNVFCKICEVHVNLKSPIYRDYFAILDVSSEIKHLIESNSEYYTEVISGRRASNNNNLKDIYDGYLYKKFLASLPDEDKNYATITFNSDGAAVFKISKFSVWPIQITVNEVPVKSRNKPIVRALWFGRDKPNMTTFLNCFVKRINEYSMEGIATIINNEVKKIKLFALCCCVGSVARAPMQGMVQFNGFFGCNWCLQHGESVSTGRGHALKYPIPNVNEVIKLRTEEEKLIYLQEALATGKTVFGVKSATPLLNLSLMDFFLIQCTASHSVL